MHKWSMFISIRICLLNRVAQQSLLDDSRLVPEVFILADTEANMKIVLATSFQSFVGCHALNNFSLALKDNGGW